MSLINDALKRASNGKRRDESEGPLPHPTFEDRSRLAGAIIPVLLVLIVIAAAGYGAWMLYSKRQVPTAGAKVTPKAEATAPATNNPVARARATLEGMVERNNVEQDTNPQPAFPGVTARPAGEPATSAPQAAPAPGKAAPVASAPTSEPARKLAPGEFPELKVQAIYYRLKGPSVLINGRTVKQGEEIEGARVLKIDRNSVTVQANGQTRVLKMN